MPFDSAAPTPAPEASEAPVDPVDTNAGLGGRRKRSNGSRKNSWLSHVKATMKVNRNKSFKQVLKLAKKTYKKSQSQSSSQSGGKGYKKNKRGGNSMKQSIDSLLQKQQGGSGMAGKPAFGSTAENVA